MDLRVIHHFPGLQEPSCKRLSGCRRAYAQYRYLSVQLAYLPEDGAVAFREFGLGREWGQGALTRT